MDHNHNDDSVGKDSGKLKADDNTDHPNVAKKNDSGDNNHKDLFSETKARQRFDAWCSQYRKCGYEDEEEEDRRFLIFKEALEWVTRENQKLGYRAYGLDFYSDITNEEFRSKYNMLLSDTEDEDEIDNDTDDDMG